MSESDPSDWSPADRQLIEAALERVHAGELSPSQATDLVLAHKRSDRRESVEPLRSLVDRLGTPPPDIVQNWCHQVRRIAAVHECEQGRPFPALRLADWAIDARGRLAWKGQFAIESGDVSLRFDASEDRCDQLPDLLRSDPVQPCVIPLADDVVRHADDVVRHADDVVRHADESFAPVQLVQSTGEKEHDSGVRSGPDLRPRRRARQIGFAVAFVSAAAILGVLYQASLAKSDRNKTDRNNDNGVSSSDGTDDRKSTPNRRKLASPDAVTDSFGTDFVPTRDSLPLESMRSIVTGPSDIAIERSNEAAISLETLLPLTANFLNAGARPRDDSQTSAIPVDRDQEDVAEQDSAHVTDAAETEKRPPEETPQVIRVSTVTAVELPAIGSEGSVELNDLTFANPTLSFPFDVPLTIEADEQGCEIRDQRKELAIATIQRAGNMTRMTWHADATKSSNANALAHGRLMDGHRRIYLRPLIESDPWPIRLRQPDVRPTWDLRHPIPPRVTRFAAEFTLPQGVDIGWIEPIDPQAIRRARAVAVLTPTDGETVALGIRFDIRGGRKLSVRIRFAARLDPGMPWQVVSGSHLIQYADQLTQQATVVSREKERLAGVYETADTLGRRLLRVKQARVETQSESLRSMSQRLTLLQAMVAGLEAEGTIAFRVWVQWPDEQQLILDMPTDERDREDSPAKKAG